MINLQKSSITYGDIVPHEIKDSIYLKLGIKNVGGVSSYIGLSDCFSGSKVDMLGS